MSDQTLQNARTEQRASDNATPATQRQPSKPAPGTDDKRKHIDETMRKADKHRGNGY